MTSCRFSARRRGSGNERLQWPSQRSRPRRSARARTRRTPLYLRYNTGLNIADNGEALASAARVAARTRWPCRSSDDRDHRPQHGRAGRAQRAASCGGIGHAAGRRGSGQMVIPRHAASRCAAGARRPLARFPAWNSSAYTAPFTRIGGLRSAGIKDLRHGTIVEPAAHRGSSQLHGGSEGATRFGAHAGRRRRGSAERPPGRRRPRAARQRTGAGTRTSGKTLARAAERQWVARGTAHLDVLSKARGVPPAAPVARGIK